MIFTVTDLFSKMALANCVAIVDKLVAEISADMDDKKSFPPQTRLVLATLILYLINLLSKDYFETFWKENGV